MKPTNRTSVLLLASTVFACQPDRELFAIETNAGDNAWVCTCSCSAFGRLQNKSVEVCAPPNLNPAIDPSGHEPSVDEMDIDCAARVGPVVEVLGRLVYSTCELDCGPCRAIKSTTDADCDVPCQPIPLPPGADTEEEIAASGATFVPDDVEGCGRLADTPPICTPDPPAPDPRGLVAVFMTPSSEVQVTGRARIEVDDDDVRTSDVTGSVFLIGPPCPGASCDVAIAFLLDASSIRFSAFLGLGAVRIRDISFSGRSLGVATLDAAGAGTFGPGEISATGRGTKQTVLGTPFGDIVLDSEKRALQLPNTGPVDIQVDWAGRGFQLEDEFTGTADGRRVVVTVDLDGTIVNQPPNASAGPDQIVECTSPAGATIGLDGNSSTDPDGNISRYDWRRTDSMFGDVVATTPVTSVEQSVGATETYSLRVFDSFMQLGKDRTVVAVADTTAPEITSLDVDRDCLWPPNHKYVRFRLEEELRVQADDVCDPSPVVRVVGVESNEADDANGVGDGHTIDDVIVGPSGFCLRAERAGTGGGRIYTVTLEASDHAGNRSQVETAIVVPHDATSSLCPPLAESELISDEEAITACVFPEIPEANAVAHQPAAVPAPAEEEPRADAPGAGCSAAPISSGPGACVVVLLLAWPRGRYRPQHALAAVALLLGCEGGPSGTVTTLAGNGEVGYVDGEGVMARFNLPVSLAIEGTTIYIADSQNNRIRRLSLVDGIVTTVAGGGSVGFEDGPVATARLGNPHGVAVDGRGGLVFTDCFNTAIRRLDFATMEIATITGGPFAAGFADGSLAEARFRCPWHLCVDAGSGTIFVADTWNNAVRKIDMAADRVTTVAGNGTRGYANGAGARIGTAVLNRPKGVAVDGHGGIFIADTDNHIIRHFDSGGAETSAAPFSGMLEVRGYREADALNARYAMPTGLAVTSDGRLIVTDVLNQVIRAVSPSGTTTLLAGRPGVPAAGLMQADGPAAEAIFTSPVDVEVGPTGEIYEVDTNRIRVIRP